MEQAMPLSQDPDKRAKQLANLHPTAAARHGAFSPATLAPLRERYLAELRGRFPNAGEDLLLIQASRLSQMDLLTQFLDRRGPIRHHRRGEIFPAAVLLEKLTAAYERQCVLLERERSNGGATPAARLEAHLANTYPTDGEGA